MAPGAGWVAVCTLDHLIARKIVCARAAGTDVIVITDARGIYACERACPHEQADLSLGHVADARIHCPRHQASFDLHNGAISAGWSSRSLQRFPVKVVEGEVWLDVSCTTATDRA